jgi:hypothetical protein
MKSFLLQEPYAMCKLVSCSPYNVLLLKPFFQKLNEDKHECRRMLLKTLSIFWIIYLNLRGICRHTRYKALQKATQTGILINNCHIGTNAR